MNISRIIMLLIAVFFVLGALDRLAGSRFGLGGEFERAFALMGNIALSVLGLMAFAPILAKALLYVIEPLFSRVGADPAMFPGILMSCDVGYPLSRIMAADQDIALFGGLIVGSVMGNTVSFVIPVACGIISREDYRPLAVGVLAAYVVDPAACFLGGLLMGLAPSVVLLNLAPVLAISLLIILGLFLSPGLTIRLFRGFARLIMAVITVGLCAAAVEAMTGFVLIPGMNPISEGFKTVGTIILSIGGSLPLLAVLRRVLRRPLEKFGRLLGVNPVTILSMVLSLTSVVPGYTSYHEMNTKGKVVFAAFTASASAAFGSHLGFTAATDQSIVAPMLLSQLLAGTLAIVSSLFFAKRIFTREELAHVRGAG
ncbi:MAG: ethanolamine utilization protein EutH [Oscillospiraceae bacterium]